VAIINTLRYLYNTVTYPKRGKAAQSGFFFIKKEEKNAPKATDDKWKHDLQVATCRHNHPLNALTELYSG